MTATPDGPLPGSKVIVGVELVGPWRVVELCGELDVATAPAAIDRIDKLLAMAGRPRVALELSQLTFCDSSGRTLSCRCGSALPPPVGSWCCCVPGGT